MGISKYKWLLFFAFLWVIYLPDAYGQTYDFKTYSIQDGLSQSVAQTLFQDKKGFIWIGTGYGLNRFDGIHFKSYFVEQGLIHNKIYSLWQDARGRIWIGTERGISIYDNGSITSPANIDSVIQSPVNDIYHDNKDRIWMATEGDGVYYLNRDKLIHIGVKEGLPNNRVRSVVEDSAGTIWMGTDGGIGIWNNGSIKSLTTADGLVDNHIICLYKDKDGSFWIGTQGGLSHFIHGRFINFISRDGIPFTQIHCLLRDRMGILWIGTEDGLIRYKNNRFKKYTIENGLSNNYIYSMMEDSEGDLWLGTFGGGINRFTGEFITNYTIANGLNNNVVTAICPDSGEIWIGTYGGGLNIYRNNHLISYKYNRLLPDSRIFSLHRMNDSTIWVNTMNGIALMRHDKLSQPAFLKNLPSLKIRCAIKDNAGRYWIGTDDEGVLVLNNGKIRRITARDGLAGNNIRCIMQDREGNIWIGTYEGASRLYNGKIHNYTIADGLPNNGVLDIYQDDLGNIWFSTFGGIGIMSGHKIRRITSKNSSENTVYYTVIQDSSKAYWIGSSKGILYLPQKRLTTALSDKGASIQVYFKRYTSDMGLVTNEMNWGAIAKDKHGNIWFGSVSGLIKINTRLKKSSVQGPPVYITGISVMDKSVLGRKNLQLDYDQNFLTFNFVGLSYSSPDRVLYEYRLHGADPHWMTTNTGSARYSALKDGAYTFQVRARNNDGSWSPSTASFSFVIRPPFWQTWWFRFLILTIVIAIGTLVYNNIRISRMADMERIRVRIASDLHDDVGSSLTEIALQSDFIQSNQLPDEVTEAVRQIGDQSRKVVNTMDDIVWSIDARNDTIGDLTDRMQDYANRVLVPKQVIIHYNLQELENQKKIPVELRQNLYLIFKEAINNIVRHSNADRVDVTLMHNNGSYTLTIRDNGHNGSEPRKKTGHGLRNMKMRGDIIGAQVIFKNDDGFTVEITGKGL